jgi:hypothetical protein
MPTFAELARLCALGAWLTTSVVAADPPDALPEAPTQEVVDAAVQRACELLLSNQERYVPDPPVGRLPDDDLPAWQDKEAGRLDGLRKDVGSEASEWPYEGVYRVRPDGRIPPGYRVGGTAIVCSALLAAPGFDAERRAAVLRGVEFMLDMIRDDDGLAAEPQTTYDVRGWGQTYALDLLLRAGEADLYDGDEDLAERVEKTIGVLLQCLDEGQLEDGGWNYAGPRGSSPFMTGATLLALYRAQAAGYDVDPDMVKDALRTLERGRGPSMAYAYSGPLEKPTDIQGSSARSSIAELALYLGGATDETQLTKAVDAFFVEENWQALHDRKSQQGTHEKPYGVAPYYFFFGHTYAAVAAEHLPEEGRDDRREAMRALLWRTLEERGGWNDRVFPRTESYSTAMAILALVAQDLPPVPRFLWPDTKAK